MSKKKKRLYQYQQAYIQVKSQYNEHDTDAPIHKIASDTIDGLLAEMDALFRMLYTDSQGSPVQQILLFLGVKIPDERFFLEVDSFLREITRGKLKELSCRLNFCEDSQVILAQDTTADKRYCGFVKIIEKGAAEHKIPQLKIYISAPSEDLMDKVSDIAEKLQAVWENYYPSAKWEFNVDAF